jgi:hypothetical protein
MTVELPVPLSTDNVENRYLPYLSTFEPSPSRWRHDQINPIPAANIHGYV